MNSWLGLFNPEVWKNTKRNIGAINDLPKKRKGSLRDFGKNYKELEKKYSVLATKPSIHTKDGKVVPITPGSKDDSLTWDFNTTQAYQTQEAVKTNITESAKGTIEKKSSDQNADIAVNTPKRSRWGPDEVRGHTLNRTGSAGGKGSVANNKEILRRMREDQAAKVEQKSQSLNQQPNLEKEYQNVKNPKNSQGYPVQGEYMPSNPKIWSKEQQEEIIRKRGGDPNRHLDSSGKPISTGKANEESLTQTTNSNKGDSAWSKMNAGAKVEVIAKALQALDGSKDELHWMGSGWGGIGSGGHSGYVG